MKITKFVHSCLLVETNSQVVLFDPGIHSWESGLWTLEVSAKVQAVVITHEHADHIHVPFLRAILETSPNIRLYANEAVAMMLEQEGFRVLVELPTTIERFTAPHEDILLSPAPQNNGYHLEGTFTHPGDSHSFDQTKRILALPLTAPWGSAVGALKLALKLRPEIVIPIHDWHWRPEALWPFYERYEKYLANEGIRFIKPVDGQSFEL